jgi:ceramide glucosyltransferase
MTTFLLLWLFAQVAVVAFVWLFTVGLGEPADRDLTGRVVLIVAVKGPDPEFDHFLAGLAAQNYPDFRTVFAVQAADDPAVAQVERFRAGREDRVAIVVAGLVEDEGQKSANLRAALKSVTPSDDFVVFADANIRPDPDWLRRLIAPLARGEAEVVSGFAWGIPAMRTLPSFALTGMSNALITVPRLPLFNAAWGGSTALRRDKCEALDLDRGWRGTVSDDLQLTRLALKAGYRISVPRELLPRAFITAENFGDLFSEGVRWLLLFRVYMPATFALVICLLTLNSAGWLLALAGTLAGNAFAFKILLAAFVLMLARTAGRVRIAMTLWGKPGIEENRAYFYFDAVLAPLATTLSAACAWIALFRSETTWAGVTYALDGPQRVRIIRR